MEWENFYIQLFSNEFLCKFSFFTLLLFTVKITYRAIHLIKNNQMKHKFVWNSRKNTFLEWTVTLRTAKNCKKITLYFSPPNKMVFLKTLSAQSFSSLWLKFCTFFTLTFINHFISNKFSPVTQI